MNVVSKINTIREVFLDAQQATIKEQDFNLLLKYLENTDTEFRSVAYEAASAAMAVDDFKNNNALRRWNSFRELTLSHGSQVHVGLGWGAAQARLFDFLFLEGVPPMMQARVIDGYGYYDGMVRQRLHVVNRITPEHLPSHLHSAYDQGIGRSLWYLSQGNVEQLAKTVAGFDASRLVGLWRGIGVACAYVGGCNEATLKNIFTMATTYQSQLAAGAALAARARITANSLASGTKAACKLWCRLSITDSMLLTIKAENAQTSNRTDAYQMWLTEIEKEF